MSISRPIHGAVPGQAIHGLAFAERSSASPFPAHPGKLVNFVV